MQPIRMPYLTSNKMCDYMICQPVALRANVIFYEKVKMSCSSIYY